MATEIPTEVLELLFQQLVHDDAIRHGTNMTTVLVICRRWYDVFLQLLWKDLAFCNLDQLIRFSSAPASIGFSLIRSLTISLEPLLPQTVPGAKRTSGGGYLMSDMLEDFDHIVAHGNKATNCLWVALKQLPTLTSQMSNLHTFSFSVKWEKYVVPPTGFWLEHRAIYDIVHSLPTSLKNLELDTKAQENTTGTDGEWIICNAIGSRLDHLEHVRLRLKRYCSKLFGPSTTLKTLSVSMIESLGRSAGNLRCDDGAKYRTWRHKQEGRQQGRKTRNELIESAQRPLEPLPSLQKLVLTEMKVSEEDSMALILVRDIKNSKTIAMPVHHVPEKHIVQLRHFSDDSAFKDAAGSIMNLTEAAEGNLWVTTEAGSRFPAAYRDSVEGRGHKWSARNSYETKEQFLARNNGEKVGLWKDEDEVGEPLVGPRQFDGLGEVEPIFKGKAKHEREFGEDRDSDFEIDFDEDGNQVDPTV